MERMRPGRPDAPWLRSPARARTSTVSMARGAARVSITCRFATRTSPPPSSALRSASGTVVSETRFPPANPTAVTRSPSPLRPRAAPFETRARGRAVETDRRAVDRDGHDEAVDGRRRHLPVDRILRRRDGTRRGVAVVGFALRHGGAAKQKRGDQGRKRNGKCASRSSLIAGAGDTLADPPVDGDSARRAPVAAQHPVFHRRGKAVVHPPRARRSNLRAETLVD